MTVQELIRALQRFDEQHQVVTQDGQEYEKIAQVVYNGDDVVICKD